MGEAAEVLEQEEEDGLVIALSAYQMAAVLQGETLEPGGTIGNRLIGGLRVLGCVAEEASAAALLAAPEPTMLTKVGGAALAVHGADQCATGLTQVWTGRDQRSLTERATSSLARRLGASPQLADNIGTATDFVVPVAGAALAGAIRAGAIRAGRISLMAHEARPGSRIGGHTIAMHVGKTEPQLRQRLVQTATLRRPPPAISSFADLAAAETRISQALRLNASRIAQWSANAGPGTRLAFDYDAGRVVGQGVVRATGQLQQMTRLRIVLKKETYNGMAHYILTAFPIP